MVVIKGGLFVMGSPATEEGRGDDEGPQHEVSVQPFALGRCEVTVAEFRRFIEERTAAGAPYTTSAEAGKGCNVLKDDGSDGEVRAGTSWKQPGFNQADSEPVVCVSYDDALTYVAWLSARTGVVYRLPSEAEWEYAARGGSRTARYWGEDAACKFANVADATALKKYAKWTTAKCLDGVLYTSAAANYLPNGFGLYDMLGNVSEWTADCWHGNYADAPQDGSPWGQAQGGNCAQRVVRGGSWNYFPARVRSAFRFRVVTDVAYGALGFRLARTLP